MPDESPSAFDESIPEPIRKILDHYRKVLFAEMYYLRDNGGRQYKVTDGRLISQSGGIYVYSFTLEAELFLSEDAPVRLTVGSKNIKGKVLSCEDFQILVSLDVAIGEKISQGYINAEPWKLLQSLIETLEKIKPQQNPIAMRLIAEGPTLRTNNPIANVDTGQDAAMTHALKDRITVIWGPPGTGKTYTMAQIAIRLLSEGKSVLAVSHSNISVDGIALKVAELMRHQGKEDSLAHGSVIRFGHVRDNELGKDKDVTSHNAALKRKPEIAKKINTLLREKQSLKKSGEGRSARRVEIERALQKAKKILSEEEKECVKDARFVATTVSRLYANKLFENARYDVVLFDEISMAYVPQVFCAAMFANEKMICVGDFRQLAPIAQGRSSKDVLSRDLFWYLGICNERQQAHYHPWLVMLDKQRRMHPQISAFPSKRFYGGLLQDHSSVLNNRKTIAEAGPNPNRAISLIDLSGTYCTADKNSDNSRFNILSAAVSFGTGITAGRSKRTVAIISPYVAQVRLIRAMLKDSITREMDIDVSCATVHQFQGSERDIVIMDLVESFPANKPGILMSNNENGSVDRLLNVAITRARGKLITIANNSFWKSTQYEARNSFTAFVSHQDSIGCSSSAGNGKISAYLSSIDFGKNIELHNDKREAIDRLIYDIDHAARKIAISIPDGSLIRPYDDLVHDHLKEAKFNGVTIIMKCSNWKILPEDWKSLGWQSEDARIPLIIIDDEICWHGLPLSRGKIRYDTNKTVETKLQIPLRITGKHTLEMIRSFTDIESRTIDNRKQALTPRKGAYEQNDKGEGVDGLALYLKQHKKCPSCNASMELSKGFRSGKFYLKCSSCGKTELLDKNLVNHYICVSQVRCPKCKGYLTAKVGKHGIFTICERDHITNVDQI